MRTRCGWRLGSGPPRKASVCPGSIDRAAYLRGRLSMPGSCARCPSGCHPFEERETLMGTKGLLKASSYCKLAQRSLQSKKSLWFCTWHIYAPFLLGTRLSASEWISTFRKEESPGIRVHQRNERKARSLRAANHKPSAPHLACSKYVSSKDCKICVSTLYQPLLEARGKTCI